MKDMVLLAIPIIVLLLKMMTFPIANGMALAAEIEAQQDLPIKSLHPIAMQYQFSTNP